MTSNLKKPSRHLWVAGLLFFSAVCVYSHGLGQLGAEYRDDEIFYYQSTQEMVAQKNYLSPTYFGQDRFQKPILFYWFILFSYKVFGVNWFAARFVSVFFAGLTIAVTWLTARLIYEERKALLGVLVLASSPIFFRHAKNAVPDMAFIFFIVWAVYLAARIFQNCERPSETVEKSENFRLSMLFFTSMALGFMVKGFASLVVAPACVAGYILLGKKRGVVKHFHILPGLILFLTIVVPWFLWMLMRHGDTYYDYMVTEEVRTRILGDHPVDFLSHYLAIFMRNFCTYFSVTFLYYLPWSPIFFVGAMISLSPLSRDPQDHPLTKLLWTWIGVVVFLFSAVFYVIAHYMLALAVPLSILTGHFLIDGYKKSSIVQSVMERIKKGWFIFCVSWGCFAFSFIFVFMAGEAKEWLILFALIYVAVLFRMINSRIPWEAPVIFGVMFLFFQSQVGLLEKARIPSLSALREFASIINQDPDQSAVIAVASNDIHEKEFQVFFRRPVKKAFVYNEYETYQNIRHMFNDNGKIYCLLTEKDYYGLFKRAYPGPVRIMKEDWMCRKRFYLDKDFFMALIRFDQDTVNRYLKEKVLLILRS